ncbi:hypothetical protein ACET3X_009278 [Alternaria dauci]|uniref:Uncharacterized protein n=1 Tax=Alternaria dauci TaxID=48095 RepID=A0ABR3UAV8_9PLEO
MKLLIFVLLGLVALIAASPVQATTLEVPKYKNDGVHIYKCDGGINVLSCVTSGTCSFVEHCSTACFVDRQGAGCTRPATVAVEASEKRDTDIEAEAEKTYECSNDHTGVLVCQYGFCQTDHYCKKGTKCRDNCSCCRKVEVLERGVDNLDAVKPESDDDVHALPVAWSDTLASRANNAPRDGGCAPGTYSCAQKTATQLHSWIVVCGYNGVYQYSSDCGETDCITDNVVAHCWNPGEEWKSYSSVAAGPEYPPQKGPYVPGTYNCALNPSTNTAWVTVCDWNQKLRYSSDCGEQKCMAGDSGVAHCWNQGDEWNANSASVSRRDEPEEVSSDLALPDKDLAPAETCSPGSFGCTWREATHTSWVITCDQSGNWKWSSDCGRGMECDYANGVAHCVPPQSTLGARDELPKVPEELAPMAICRPGDFACSFYNQTMTDWVIVCDQSGDYWHRSSNCGKDMKCISGGGVAHCVAQLALFEAWEAVQSLDLSANA